MSKQNEGKEKERVCFWEVADVESNGDIIVRVFNKEKQDELNALAGRAKARHTKAYNKTREQDDRYNELVNILGFEAQAEVFSTAGKAYVYNTKRELIKDIKFNENIKAMQEGRKANKKEPKEKIVRAKKSEQVRTVDLDSLVDFVFVAR